MKVIELHKWEVSLKEAEGIQRALASRVSTRNEVGTPRLIAGVDISPGDSRGLGRGSVVVLSYPGLEVVERSVVEEKLTFPYVPGLLSFRESPLILAACERVLHTPDLILVDGQGLAHPRRLGLASHLGLLLDTPTIGCAKSRLLGSHGLVGAAPGAYAELFDDGEVIGAALRTKMGATPLYVSIGHKVDLKTALYWVLECCRGHRLPEPTRLAHLAAAGQLEEPIKSYQRKLID